MTQLVENILSRGIPYAWSITVTGLALLLYALVRARLNRTESKLHRRLEHLKNVSTIDTESPLEDHGDSFREQGLERLHTRFRGLRRVLYPTLFLAWLFLVSMPLLEKMPAALLSFLHDHIAHDRLFAWHICGFPQQQGLLFPYRLPAAWKP